MNIVNDLGIICQPYLMYYNSRKVIDHSEISDINLFISLVLYHDYITSFDMGLFYTMFVRFAALILLNYVYLFVSCFINVYICIIKTHKL
jgi:hypothetical protein